MDRLVRLLLLAGVAVGLAGCGQTPPGPGKDQPAEVRLEVVSYDRLGRAIESHKGKVVVMDVWATWCVPCRREFPHLVELHREHAGDGLVCVSVSVDEPSAREDALKFLRSKGATFPNYLLDEKSEVWQERWRLKGVPAVFVYGRDGKLARKFTNDDPDDQFTYGDVRKFVEGLLRSGGQG
jgi:thiol-disulfide isomerase/thioredoxin